MAPQELVETALRVLQAWSFGTSPLPGDAATLREQALDSSEAQLNLDELACLIVTRECSRIIAESCQERIASIKRSPVTAIRRRRRIA